MTHFATCLTGAIAATNSSLRAVARAAGIDSSLLSRLAGGEIGPSSTNLKALHGTLTREKFPSLGRDYGSELLLAYMRDCADETGVPLGGLRIIISNTPDEKWWETVTPALAARLRILGEAAENDAEFDTLLKDFEPLALKLKAARADSEELSRLQRGKIYPFPKAPAVSAVGEDKNSEPQKKSSGKPGAAPALPVGDSQKPTA